MYKKRWSYRCPISKRDAWNRSCKFLSTYVIASILRDSVAVVLNCLGAIPPAMITMSKSIHWCLFLSLLVMELRHQFLIDFADWLTDWPTYWQVTDWRTDGLTDWRTDGLTDWRTDGLTDWRTDGLTDWRTDGLTDWRTDGLTDWRTDGLTDWRTDGLACWIERKKRITYSNFANSLTTDIVFHDRRWRYVTQCRVSIWKLF